MITRDVNYHCLVRGKPRDQDLIEAETQYTGTLPWLPGVLEELQGLRDAYVKFSVEVGLGEDFQMDLVNQDARVAYLEGVLNKIGAEYDKQTDTRPDQGRPEDAVPS